MVTKMHSLLNGVTRFRSDVFPRQSIHYQRLARDGQQPEALMISCADSRVVPEVITQCGPGELLVCRNAGNIVPPFAYGNGGVSSVIEYALVALGVRDLVVCGHSGCGAMKALRSREGLERMPNMDAWLRHSHSAECVVRAAYPGDLDEPAALRSLELENVVAQLNNLRTHPSVAAATARGKLGLHGWYFDLATGIIHALDGASGRFSPLAGDREPPVAVAAALRLAAAPFAAAAE
jgi:carbonic anhydrase